MDNCLSCKYSRTKIIRRNTRLRCQYNPPTVEYGAKMVITETRFPWVDDDDWCGKFERR